MKTWISRASAIAVALSALLATTVVAAGVWATDRIFLEAPRTHSTRTPADTGLVFEDVTFTSVQDVTLEGWWIPAQHCGEPCLGKGTVVAADGYTGNRANILDVSAMLTREGFNVFAVNLRGQGGSGGYPTLGFQEPSDLAAAVAVARAKSPSPSIGLYGRSMAASSAIIAAARENRVRPGSISAVVEDSGFAWAARILRHHIRKDGYPETPTFQITMAAARARLGIDLDSVRVSEAAAAVGAPLMVIHGDADSAVPVRDAMEIFEAASDPKELWILPGVGHVAAAEIDPKAFRAKVGGFFDEWLGAEGQPSSERARIDLHSDQLRGGIRESSGVECPDMRHAPCRPGPWSAPGLAEAL